MVDMAILLHTSRILCELIEEESDEEDDIEWLNPLLDLIKRDKPIRILNYFEHTVPALTDKQFQWHFRVTPAAFELLENMISHLICAKPNAHRKAVTERKQILMVLWLIATPDSFRSVGERFDVGKSTLWACFYRVIKALNNISSRVISWPNAIMRRGIQNRFLSYGNMPNVVGAIDGTYVPIKAPRENPEVYVNRKCFHGITLQAISDPSLKFLHIFTGYPSSVSDVRIFKNSDIYKKLKLNPDNYITPEEFLLGDKAYPLYKWCIPPYINRGNLGQVEINFNTIHARMRQVVERTFALYFGRMRRMQYLDMNRADLYPYVIKAACILHNICLLKTDNEVNNYIEEGLQHIRQHNNDENNEEAVGMIALTNAGRDRRNRIALALIQRLPR